MSDAVLTRASPRRTGAHSGRQTAIGLGLSAAIVAAWLALHLSGLFVLPLTPRALPLALLVAATQCWLSVGLFIVAHDAMHGSLAPFRPRLNRAVGRVALMLYAGIWYDSLVARHFAHHRAPGTEQDPDFDHASAGAGGFWRWYAAFFLEYLTLGQVLRFGTVAALYCVVFRVAPERLVLFWALPSLAASLQLFYFGTFLPHRRGATPFPDHHRARSNAYSYLASLATCFHFGYHHEHHADPSVPWWRLPALRAGRSDNR